MMAETITQTFNSKRLYKKQKETSSDISSICSSKNSLCSSTTTTTTTANNSNNNNNNDWHRLLLTRLKPGVAGKYRTIKKNDNKSDTFSSTSCNDSTVTLQSYSDDSTIIDNHQIIINELDMSKQLDCSLENSIRRDNRFVKNSMSYRSTDNMTSLKRRVRKQQMRHLQNQQSILQETTFQLPSPSDLLLVSYPEQSVSPRRYKPKKSNSIVTLPSLINTTRTIPTQIHGIKLNLYGY